MKRNRAGIEARRDHGKEGSLEGSSALCPRGTKNRGKAAMRKCGLLTRVGTQEQTGNGEDSLSDQLQRLRAHLKYKGEVAGQRWVEAERYELKGVSGNGSFKSKEFARLLEDIRSGRINTVLCTALDRVSRSVKDFLGFVELLNKHKVEFCCLEQGFDTASPLGRLLMAVMAALAEFEREQMRERMRRAKRARNIEN